MDSKDCNSINKETRFLNSYHVCIDYERLNADFCFFLISFRKSEKDGVYQTIEDFRQKNEFPIGCRYANPWHLFLQNRLCPNFENKDENDPVYYVLIMSSRRNKKFKKENIIKESIRRELLTFKIQELSKKDVTTMREYLLLNQFLTILPYYDSVTESNSGTLIIDVGLSPVGNLNERPCYKLEFKPNNALWGSVITFSPKDEYDKEKSKAIENTSKNKEGNDDATAEGPKMYYLTEGKNHNYMLPFHQEGSTAYYQAKMPSNRKNSRCWSVDCTNSTTWFNESGARIEKSLIDTMNSLFGDYIKLESKTVKTASHDVRLSSELMKRAELKGIKSLFDGKNIKVQNTIAERNDLKNLAEQVKELLPELLNKKGISANVIGEESEEDYAGLFLVFITREEEEKKKKNLFNEGKLKDKENIPNPFGKYEEYKQKIQQWNIPRYEALEKGIPVQGLTELISAGKRDEAKTALYNLLRQLYIKEHVLSGTVPESMRSKLGDYSAIYCRKNPKDNLYTIIKGVISSDGTVEFVRYSGEPMEGYLSVYVDDYKKIRLRTSYNYDCRETMQELFAIYKDNEYVQILDTYEYMLPDIDWIDKNIMVWDKEEVVPASMYTKLKSLIEQMTFKDIKDSKGDAFKAKLIEYCKEKNKIPMSTRKELGTVNSGIRRRAFDCEIKEKAIEIIDESFESDPLVIATFPAKNNYEDTVPLGGIVEICLWKESELTFGYTSGQPSSRLNNTNLKFKRPLVRRMICSSEKATEYVPGILEGLDDLWNAEGDYSARPGVFKLLREFWEIEDHKNNGQKVARLKAQYEGLDADF